MYEIVKFETPTRMAELFNKFSAAAASLELQIGTHYEPDMCCDDHATFYGDDVFLVDRSNLTSTFASAYMESLPGVRVDWEDVYASVILGGTPFQVDESEKSDFLHTLKRLEEETVSADFPAKLEKELSHDYSEFKVSTSMDDPTAVRFELALDEDEEGIPESFSDVYLRPLNATEIKQLVDAVR